MTIHYAGDGRKARTVTLDGVDVKMCVYADDVSGIVTRYKQPLQKVININGDEEFEVETLTGKVVVKMWGGD